MLLAERWILAVLRNRSFYSLAELQTAVALLLERLKSRPMRRLGQSRSELFEAIMIHLERADHRDPVDPVIHLGPGRFTIPTIRGGAGSSAGRSPVLQNTMEPPPRNG